MRDVPRWLKAATFAAVVTLVVALAKPAIAGLLLRALAVGAATALAIVVVARALHGMEPADGIGRRLDPRAPADLPRELAALTTELRTQRRRDPLSPTVLRPLRSAMQHRLWYHHGLSTTITEHDAAIRARVSPTAYLVLQAARLGDDGVVVPGSELPALIEEVERL